jgi:hypothetical protein
MHNAEEHYMSTNTRIESLEHQVRTLKRMLLGVFGLVVVGGLLAATTLQSVPDVLRAKKFEVVNDEGKVIVRLSNLEGGGVDNGMLETRNSAGQRLVALGAIPGGGVVETQNGKGQTLVLLGVTTEGTGSVKTQNGKGQSLVQLGVTVGGEGAVTTENGKGGTLVRLGVTTDGQGSVTTQNGKGQSLVHLSATVGGEGAVNVNNAQGGYDCPSRCRHR